LDNGLLRFRNELTASALLQQALHAYHDPVSSGRILDLGRRAMQELRQSLIPPTTNEPGEEDAGARRKTPGRAAPRPLKTPMKSSRSVSDSRTKAAMRTPTKAAQQKAQFKAVETPSLLFEDAGRLARMLCEYR
jgi:hypothetical protein